MTLSILDAVHRVEYPFDCVRLNRLLSSRSDDSSRPGSGMQPVLYHHLTIHNDPIHAGRELPHWIRRRLRAVVWKHWKNRKTRVRELLKRGVSRNYAVTTGCARKGPWRTCHAIASGDGGRVTP